MSSAARFLLEFEATGDQEVVSKIKAVGAAGKETATDLESLQGIQDPFAPIAEGADAAVAPIEGVGTAAETTIAPIEELTTAAEGSVTGLTDIGSAADSAVSPIEGVGTAMETATTAADDSVSIFEGAGTAVGDFTGNLDAVGGAGEAASGGLTSANTMMGTFAEGTSGAGTSATTAAGNVGEFAGSITAIGGIIGSAVGAIFRLQDAQLRLDKANLRAAKATETARKAEEAFFKLLQSAPSNREAIAAATETYIAAQEKLTALQEAGITSGAEYEAAQAAVAVAVDELRAAFVAGGGEAGKFDTALNKTKLSNDAAGVAAQTAAKALREQQTAMLDTAFSVTSIVGTIAQFVAGSKTMITNTKAMATGLKTGLAPALATIGGKFGTFALALTGALGPMAAFAAALGPAALAVGAFLVAIKLIEHFRKPIYDFFNGIGKAVGDAIPPIKAFVTELGNALDSSLEFLIRNTNALFGIQTKTVDNTFQLLSKFQKDRQSLNDEEVQSALAIIKVSKQRGETEAETVKRILPILKLEAEGKITTAEASQLMADGSANVAGATAKEGAAVGRTASAYAIYSTEADNATQLTEEEAGAMGELTGSLHDSIDAHTDMAHTLLLMAGSALNAEAAIAANNLKYAESVDRLADSNAVLGDTQARQEAVTTVANEFTASLKEQQIQLEGTLKGLRDIENQQQGVQNAILQTSVALEESNQKLREAIAIRNDSAASTNLLQTAINEEKTALLEESHALEARSAIAQDAEIQMARLATARAEGVVIAQEWIAALDEEAAKEQATISTLSQYAEQFGGLPGVMSPTVDSLQTFITANEGAGQAAVEAGQKILDAYASIVEPIKGFLDSLTKAFQESGKEQSEGLKKAWEDLPEGVQSTLSEVEQAALQSWGEMQSQIESAASAFAANIQASLAQGMSMDEALANARPALQQFLSEAEQTIGPGFEAVFDKAQEIAATGSADMIQQMITTLQSPVPADQMLAQLQRIQAGAGPIGNQTGTDLGTEFETGAAARFGQAWLVVGQGLKKFLDSIPGYLANIDTSGLAASFAQGWITVGQGLKTFLDSIPGYISGLTIPPIKLTADVSQAVQKVTEFENTLVSVQAAPIRITADISQAIQAVTAFENTIVSTAASPIKITADTSVAISQLDVIKTKIGQLSSDAAATAITITANTTQAVSAFNAASTSALTMRNNVNAAAGGVKSAAASAGAAVASFSSKASSSFAKAGAAGTQMASKVKSASSNMRSALNSAASAASSFASKCVSSFNKVGSSASSNASKVRNLASAISRLKSKTITITTRYVTTGTRPAQFGMHEMVNKPTMILAGEAGPERVDITPGGTGNNVEINHTVPVGRGGGAGSNREIVIPVTLMLDNKVLIRTVRRGLVEEVSGAM